MKRKADPASILSNPLTLMKEIKKGKAAGSSSKLAKVGKALKKESELGSVLHKEALSALHRMESADPSLKRLIQQSHGYVIFPRVGKVSAVLGGAYGLGEVHERDQVAGYAALVQATVGFQLGKRMYSELVVFNTPKALEDFKAGKVSFAANASAAIVKTGAAATTGGKGMKIFVQPERGFGVEAGIGGQKFVYKPAALGRVKSAFEPVKEQLKSNLRHFGKPTNPNVPPSGGPIVPLRRTASRRAAAKRAR